MMSSNSSASIVIITYNNFEYTRQCLESIYEKTEWPDFEVIVVDNDSRDGTPGLLSEYAEEYANFRVILNPTNEGFARGNNIGAAAATGEYLIFLNNDTVVTAGWLSGLIRYLQDPTVGMVGPVTNASGNETRIRVDYGDLVEMKAFALEHTTSHQGQSFEILMLAFMCVAMRRNVFEEIGPLDERFGLGMFEDDDYALRLKQNGYKLLCAEDVFIHHWGSASFSKLNTTEYWTLFNQNLQKFEAKWDCTWYPHQNRQELLPEQIRELLDGSIWLSNSLAEQQEKAEGLQLELDNIYSSNIWAFMQSLLRFRFRIVPHGSRREALFKLIVDLFRNLKLERFLGTIRRSVSILRNPKPASPVLQAASEYLVEGIQITPSWPINRTCRPFVSVILPVYNHADLLLDSALSVLNGTYNNLELIILDDGSTDDLEPVLRHLLINPRVRVYRQPNQKLPRALTHAHKLVRGDFITWTSSDNLVSATAIETMVSCLLSHPEATLVYADVALIDQDGRFLIDRSYRPQNIDPDRPEVVRLHRNALPLGYELDNYINACFLYRNKAAQALEGYYADDLLGYEDYDFWLRLQKLGSFQHLSNDEPLYFYRVHRRTMSDKLLSDERDSHFTRGKQLMAYESLRRDYTSKPWAFILEDSLSKDQKAKIAELARSLPGEVYTNEEIITHTHKRLHFTSRASDYRAPVSVHVNSDSWELIWQSSQSIKAETLGIWRGAEIHPLALKAREYKKNTWVIPQAGDRAVIGCHIGLGSLPVDVDLVRKMVAKNTWAYFVFVDLPGDESPHLGHKIVADLENAGYIESQNLGEPYQIYACFDMVWIPPLEGEMGELCYRQILALAYAIARPLLVPRGFQFIPSPYQFYYHPGEVLTSFQSLDRQRMDVSVLDRYLEAWTPIASLRQLTNYADAITQNIAVPRPDFKVEIPPTTQPELWQASVSMDKDFLKCALVVNSLDKGGLEELVAHLARRLPDRGVEIFVLCVHKGGTIAERLRAVGVKVIVANGQEALITETLIREKPDVVNTHLADKLFLEIAYRLGIPIVEVIHNTYVWFNDEDWELEWQRSRYFSHAIAVSQLVKNYYLKKNHLFAPEWISIIPNGIDPDYLRFADRDRARKELGLLDETFLFLFLASYFGNKNQLATLTAFNEVAQRYTEAKLWCVGNVAEVKYFDELRSYRETLKSKDQIELYEFRQDAGILLSAANVLLINSFIEGWSMAATEALMAGIPIIHSECGSAQELVGVAQTRGMLIPNPGYDPIDLTSDLVYRTMWQKQQRNTKALVQAMIYMIENRDEWMAKREEIRNYSMKEYGIENLIERYRQVFRAVNERRNVEGLINQSDLES